MYGISGVSAKSDPIGGTISITQMFWSALTLVTSHFYRIETFFQFSQIYVIDSADKKRFEETSVVFIS